MYSIFNTLTLRQNGYFSDDIFRCIFLIENFLISNKILLQYLYFSTLTLVTFFVNLMIKYKRFLKILETYKEWVHKMC